MAYRIFVCYSQSDFFEHITKIQNYISDRFPDARVYIDQIKSKGKQWNSENEKELRMSDLVIVIITPAVSTSKSIKKEIEISKQTNKNILPCIDVGSKLKWEESPFGLEQYDGLEFTDIDYLKRKLFAAIKDIRKNGLNLFPIILEEKSIKTDKTSYSEGETIVITGEVRDLYSGTPISVIVKAPNGNLVSIVQLKVGTDKKFWMYFICGGALMKIEGKYTIAVQYGTVNRSAETAFEFKKVKNTLHIIKICSHGIPSDSTFTDSPNLRIKSGDTVKWINASSAAHTLTAGTVTDGLTGEFDSGLLMSGGDYETVFTERKTYEYSCMVHPWEKDTIIVE